MECYLDNSATTRVYDEVCSLTVKLMREDFGNPSSMHKKGFEAEKYVKEAKDIFAKIWKCQPGEIYFTSGGTESDNMAIMGTVLQRGRQGKHIITTVYEHAAVLSPMGFLEEMGYEVTYLKVDENGMISLEELESAIRDDTILVSIMHVNNEIGSVLPVEAAGKIIKAKNKNCLFHVDDIQGFSKLKLIPGKMNIDMISVSGHKIGAPKGVGVLYVSRNAHIKPIILGGGQQSFMRSGTENVPGIAGIALAARLACDAMDEKTKSLYELREYFVKELSLIEGLFVNGPGGFEYYNSDENDEAVNSGLPSDFAPHIVSLSMDNVRAEVMLHALEDKEIYVSAGSACSSNKPAVSKTLKAIGLDAGHLDSTIRFSFGRETTRDELEYTIAALRKLYPVLSKYSRR